MTPGKAALQIQGLCCEYRPALLHLLDNAISPALLAQFTRTPRALLGMVLPG